MQMSSPWVQNLVQNNRCGNSPPELLRIFKIGGEGGTEYPLSQVNNIISFYVISITYFASIVTTVRSSRAATLGLGSKLNQIEIPFFKLILRNGITPFNSDLIKCAELELRINA